MCALALGLLSPLLLYARAGRMPLAALYAVAFGIAILIGLAGRRLHGWLLADALSNRSRPGRLVLLAVTTLLGVGLVVLGLAVAVALAFRSCVPAVAAWATPRVAG